QTVDFATRLDLANEGSRMPMSRAIIAMTPSNSSNVNARLAIGIASVSAHGSRANSVRRREARVEISHARCPRVCYKNYERGEFSEAMPQHPDCAQARRTVS